MKDATVANHQGTETSAMTIPRSSAAYKDVDKVDVKRNSAYAVIDYLPGIAARV